MTEGRVGSLLDAIDEGQRLWQQPQTAVAMLLGGNAGEVAFNVYGTVMRGIAPLTARQILLVNLLTDVLPTTAVAVSSVRNTRPPSLRGIDMDELTRTIAVRGLATTIGASISWSLATFTRASPRRASTVGLVGLITTQLGQTLLESHDPLVVATVAGTFVTMAALVTIPGVSQLVGCVPLGPLAWTEATIPATAVTILTAAKPHLLVETVSTLRRILGRYAAHADHRLTDTVAALNTWAYNLPGMQD